jgi:dTDP-4-dehydrorhamnose 3,5-epimerase
MKITSLPLPGAFLVEPEPIVDERGFFARSYCREEFAARGLNPMLVQCSMSFNERCGTLRGMHYQTKPHEEAKLVRCTRGAIFDVVIDLRPDSPTFKRWAGIELNAENRLALYIPEGCAHGFLTRADASEVFYQMSVVYHPECAAGVRWNDPAFAVDWPDEVRFISERDRSFADFSG